MKFYFLADINHTFCLIMTPIIPSLSPIFEFQLPETFLVRILVRGTEVRFVVFIPDRAVGVRVPLYLGHSAHLSPFTALSFPYSKKVPIFCWVDREIFQSPHGGAKPRNHEIRRLSAPLPSRNDVVT